MTVDPDRFQANALGWDIDSLKGTKVAFNSRSCSPPFPLNPASVPLVPTRLWRAHSLP